MEMPKLEFEIKAEKFIQECDDASKAFKELSKAMSKFADTSIRVEEKKKAEKKKWWKIFRTKKQ